MTHRRDLKRYVRTRASKTGQSYQATLRAVTDRTVSGEAVVETTLSLTGGRAVFGCRLESGSLRLGDWATVIRSGEVVDEVAIREVAQFNHRPIVVTAPAQVGIDLGPLDLRPGDHLVLRPALRRRRGSAGGSELA